MKKFLIKGLLLATLAVTNFACEDDYKYGELVRDNRPAVPVTFPGATTYGGNPFIEIQASGPGTIRFTLAIPESSGRTIREITTVAGGGTGVNAATLNTASAKYNTAPIPGNGTTAVFETTLAAFRTKYPTVVTTVSPNPASPREIAFIFLITLDNGDQIVTQQVRVRIL
ncbi:hypothetical protein DYU11_24620 [Fibrisoma montanum]|uniref:DUF1735 domain-containing protein n=1 Tax=Fibrisoma montanum TaxID=2305895 RepID=A0A418M102_9BACT|nr:hypothetical protein [Fibrisoma montanum]RIV19294.1 hypothetical protein DYU11_24620 [Fibrisoma montanum]